MLMVLFDWQVTCPNCGGDDIVTYEWRFEEPFAHNQLDPQPPVNISQLAFHDPSTGDLSVDLLALLSASGAGRYGFVLTGLSLCFLRSLNLCVQVRNKQYILGHSAGCLCLIVVDCRLSSWFSVTQRRSTTIVALLQRHNKRVA